MDDISPINDGGLARSTNGARQSRGKQWTKFQLVLFDVLKPGNERPYLVKGLIPRVGLTVLWGPPKCGKSFWAFDVAMHVALGWPYRDRRTTQGAVVYCAFEGADGFKARAEAFRQRHLADDHESVPFYLMPTRANLVVDHAELIRAIEAEQIAPAAVVLDTLNRSLQGSESDDKDMGAYVKAADAIREAFNCAVVIVHHCGVEGTRPRGHTSLTGAADAQLECKRQGDAVVVTVQYMKDGPEGEVITSRLESVTVGEDEDGDPITSCIVVPAETIAAQTTVRLSAREILAKRQLADALCDAGETPMLSQLPVGCKAIRYEAWRERAKENGFAAELKPAARRKAFSRAVESLQVGGYVGMQDGWVWIARDKA